MIDFLCPNGHRIRCQADHVGRVAKCPRCGVRFRVPGPAELGVSEAIGSDTNVSRPEFVDSGVSHTANPTAGGVGHKEPQIEFLCPNGHRLHGSASLQGRPGQCPECGSRFRIPTYEDISAEEEAASEIGVGRADGGAGSDVGVQASAAARSAQPGRDQVTSEESATPTTISGRSAAGQAMATLFAQLWDLRPKNAVVEVRLRDGETIVPQDFLKKASQQSRQGVFAIKEADLSLSLTVVAWDAVARVTVRGLNELPKGLAE